ncbi:Protein CBG25846 [Caenorhabditis briggsae]|uniref:Protein CBG25846 n=1 Tax=Caenorhabditis briggsae TaxID=6238 RepID=B6IHB7_CAEBR|nr:Protein CBG25846 [Caenorhabditis briggsae]CAR99297.1 Protein CBG25846 [Caenorhabditis briggsae]
MISHDVSLNCDEHQIFSEHFLFNYERLLCLRLAILAVSSVSGIINIGGGKKCGGYSNGGYGSGIIIGAPKPGGK